MITADALADAEKDSTTAHIRRTDAHRKLLSSPEDPYLQDAYKAAAREDVAALRRMVALSRDYERQQWLAVAAENAERWAGTLAILADAETPVCHCGSPVTYGFDGDPTHHRGMCEHCDAVRCDAYPGECSR